MYSIDYLFDGSRDQSLPYDIASKIAYKIFSGELEEGEKLIESKITQELGVSNIPVREAFYILQNTGMLERLPRKGVRVRTFSKKEISDYTVALIELFEVGFKFSKSKWSHSHKEQLLQYYREASNKLEEEDVIGYILQCDKLYGYIFTVADNLAFIRFYYEIKYITNAYSQANLRSIALLKDCHKHLYNSVHAIIEGRFDVALEEIEKEVNLIL